MKIEDLIGPAAVVLGLRSANKARLLEALAERAATLADLEPRPIAQALLKREELGSTGMGGGFALPHARLPGIDKPFGLVARLESPIDFEAIDGRPVDLVCLLLLPAAGEASAPLSALACVSRRLRSAELLGRLRRAADAAEFRRLLTGPALTP